MNSVNFKFAVRFVLLSCNKLSIEGEVLGILDVLKHESLDL